MKTKLIVNPTAGRGNALRQLGEVTKELHRLGVEFDLVQTERPGQALELAQEAAEAGFERVVAVGGDGTANEVLNGLMLAAERRQRAILGIIPVGSGNDFSYGLGIPLDVPGACAVLAKGSAKWIDLILATVDGRKLYAGNFVGVGFDAKVNIRSRSVPLFRGFLLYLASVFTVVAKGDWPYRVSVVDGNGNHWEEITLLAIANGPRTGGGFHLTPYAQLNDGRLDVLLAQKMGRLPILRLLPKVLKGTHLTDPLVSYSLAENVRLKANGGIPGQIDGEILCTKGKELEFQMVPSAIQVWV